MKNLKFYFLLLSFLTLTTTAFSQVKVGVRAGINSANWTIDPSDDELEFDSRSGIVFAIPVEISLTDKLALQPELMYSQYGTGYEVDFFGITTSAEFIFNYLEFIMLSFLTSGCILSHHPVTCTVIPL